MTSLNPLAQEGQLRRDETKLDDDQIEEIPAMDQVTVFGFACTQTAALMPLPIWLAHRLARHLTSVRLKGQLPYLAPDGKTQVAVEYRNHCPYRIHSIALNTATERDGTPDAHRLKDDLVATVIGPVFEEEGIKPDADTQIFVNPRGPLITGGPVVHSGLTGRKTAIDTYGEYSRHSEAALSGKSPSRIDRVGAYMARYAAKNVVMAGLAEECEVQVSYVIGQSRPVSIQVETFGTGRLTDEEITARVVRHFDFRPAAIVAQFNLRHLPATLRGGFYQRLAAYGHVGRMDIGLPWERTDKAELLGTEYGRTTSGGGIAAGR
jgi:S-adenosylmethionine synthetase